ncbi:MAG: DUF6476 family protein [Pseudomonadota bacterium]
MDKTPDPRGSESSLDPALVTYLRRLVTALAVVMIGGFLVLVGLFVSKFSELTPSSAGSNATLVLPDTLRLPDGARALAVTQGPTWYAVVTTDNRILIFDSATGALRQSVKMEETDD